MKDKIFSMIGLAQKAGKVVSGESNCEKEIKRGKSKLLIMAVDCSENTRESFRNMCALRGIDMIEIGTKEVLGKCIGKEYRAVLAVTDENFAKAIIRSGRAHV